MRTPNIHRLRGGLKVASGVLGACAVVAMGAATVVSENGEAGTTSTPDWVAATDTRTPPPEAPETSFATPPVIAIPCPKRATFPC